MENSRFERYIYAAVELDKRFRNKVLNEIVYDKFRYVAPSHGLDLVKLAKHAINARNRTFFKDILLFCLFCFTFFLAIDDYGWWGIIIFFPLLITWPLIISYIINVSLYIYSYFIVLNKLSKVTSAPKKPDWILGLSKEDSERLNKIQIEDESMVTYYGSYSPFVGAGIHNSGWSFIAETKLKGTHDYAKLDNDDLYIHISNRIKELKIPNMNIRDQLYVDGGRIRNDKRFLENMFSSPRKNINSDLLKDFKYKENSHIRFYKSIQIMAWEGDVVFSLFFRLNCTEQNIYLECQTYLLPPIRKEFEAIDRYGNQISSRVIAKAFLVSILPSFFSLLKSPSNVYKYIKRIAFHFVKQRTKEQNVKLNALFNYGATQSIREMVSENSFHNLFQLSDYEMYHKKLERRLFQSIIEYLDKLNVDTSEFKTRQENIINNGTMITGGNINANNIGNKINFSDKITTIVKDAINQN